MAGHGLADFMLDGTLFLQRGRAPRNSCRLYSERKRDGLHRVAGVFLLIFLHREAAHIRGDGPAARRACFGRRRRGTDQAGVLPELRTLLFE